MQNLKAFIISLVRADHPNGAGQVFYESSLSISIAYAPPLTRPLWGGVKGDRVVG